MNRRELIVSGLLAAGAVCMSGCSNKNSLNDSPKTSIEPKQTDTYRISTPLPFNFKLIDEMNELNHELKKSKVVSLYNSLPSPCSDYFENNFQSQRGRNDKIKSIDEFMQYVQYAKELGFEFTYVLNSPRAFTQHEFLKHEKQLTDLIDTLLKADCKNVKVANTQLFSFFKQKYGNQLNVSASTSFEYHNISQYKNLLKTNPNIKSINIATDDNRNFKLLQSLRKTMPQVNIEILVNETCIHGCPGRISHPQSRFYVWECKELREKMGSIPYFFRTNVVYPWDLEYYSAIGINSFKIVAVPFRADFSNIKYLENYLNCVENGIENLTAKDFFGGIYRYVDNDIKNNVKLAEIKPYFPDIKHFIEHGNECSNICDVDCRYCYDCINKIQEIIC